MCITDSQKLIASNENLVWFQKAESNSLQLNLLAKSKWLLLHRTREKQKIQIKQAMYVFKQLLNLIANSQSPLAKNERKISSQMFENQIRKFNFKILVVLDPLFSQAFSYKQESKKHKCPTSKSQSCQKNFPKGHTYNV